MSKFKEENFRFDISTLKQTRAIQSLKESDLKELQRCV